MAIVTCQYCKAKFDREKEAFIQIKVGKTFRYGHGDCYLEAVSSGKEKNIYTVWDPKQSSTCFWCHESLYPNQEDVIPMPQLKDRYIHKACAQEHPKGDKDELLIYLIDLYQLKDDYILPKYMNQLSKFQKEYNFTYSGMLKALKYWHDIKKHPVDKEKGLGIIPYVYKPAYDYYYALWIAEQHNKSQDLSSYIPKDIVMVIPPPQRKIEKRKLFNFLDEGEIEDNAQ